METYKEKMEYEAKKEAVIREILNLQDSLNPSDKFSPDVLWRYKLWALKKMKNKMLIGREGYITDAIGTLDCHEEYNGELLTIFDVTDEGFYLVGNQSQKLKGKYWAADCNEFQILN